jgi:hypothetical protein
MLPYAVRTGRTPGGDPPPTEDGDRLRPVADGEPCAATSFSAWSPFRPASKLASRFSASMKRTWFRVERSRRMASGWAMTPPTTPLPRP